MENRMRRYQDDEQVGKSYLPQKLRTRSRIDDYGGPRPRQQHDHQGNYDYGDYYGHGFDLQMNPREKHLHLLERKFNLNPDNRWARVTGTSNTFDSAYTDAHSPLPPGNLLFPHLTQPSMVAAASSQILGSETLPVTSRAHDASPTDNVEKVKDDQTPIFEELDWKPGSCISSGIFTLQTQIQLFVSKRRLGLKLVMIWLLFALYNIYLTLAIVHHLTNGIDIDWCDGIGFLIAVTVIVYWSLIYYFVLKKYGGEYVLEWVFVPIAQLFDKCWRQRICRIFIILIVAAGLITFLILDTADNRNRLISASGIPILLFIGLLISKHPARVVWRHVLWGTALQFIFGLIILKWPLGNAALECVSNKVERFLRFTNAGTTFVYGFLANGIQYNELSLPGVFAFAIVPTIFFFSFVCGLLYHLGVITWVVVKIGWLLQVTVGTTAAESCSAAANIFIGQTEAPLVIKPFLKEMTVSELHAVMAGGFATIAGAGMGAFIRLGISASHLLSASCMSAPAALALAKLIYPETKVSRTTSQQIYESAKQRSKGVNFLDAASEGATQAVFLVGNMIANLIAMIAFVSFLDALLSWFGTQVGFTDFSFQWILTKLFYPFAVILGIDAEELDEVAYLLGLKTVVNEFVAYQRLSTMELSPRSKAITTYAICCFANFSSIGVQLGGIGSLAPNRRPDMAKAIWRAFIAGNCAALMTACVAGSLISEMGYHEWKALGTNSTLNSHMQFQ